MVEILIRKYRKEIFGFLVKLRMYYRHRRSESGRAGNLLFLKGKNPDYD